MLKTANIVTAVRRAPRARLVIYVFRILAMCGSLFQKPAEKRGLLSGG